MFYIGGRGYIRKQYQYSENNSVLFLKWKEFNMYRRQYWEIMCDLKRKDEFKMK